tara:strand:- start:150 stop:404 length:255 start_codon:yes stop_codon:yes gene_type:complete
MSVGGKKEEYDFVPPDDNMEWWCQWKMNIKDVRMVYSSIDYYSTIWPGPPERPEEEKEFLENYKGRLFAMLTDYNFSNHEVEED